MAKSRNKQPARFGLVTPPRLYINIAIVAGGAVGLVVQSRMNVDNVGGFIVTGFFCFLAVILLNVGWLIKTRREEGR